MKILHLPYNIANWASINVQALNKLDNVEAKAIVFAEKHHLHSNEDIIFISQKNKINRYLSLVKFIKYIIWSDVVHWYFDEKIFPKDLALKIIAFYKKPAVIEWLGDDIRNPRIEFYDNPFYKREFKFLTSKKVFELEESSIQLQKKFAKYKFGSITCPEMEQYLKPELYVRNFSIRQRIELSEPKTQELNKTRNGQPIKIAHAPSVAKIKGTKYVLEAIDKLKKCGYNIHFELIQNTNHIDALKKIENCDIFIDQLILGCYGMATLEALNFNKVVLVYIKESLINSYPNTLPIVNANPENIFEKIKHLLDNPQQISGIAKLGRPYISANHDCDKLTNDLMNTYNEMFLARK